MSQSYFRNLPSFEYVSRNSGRRNLSDYTEVKNLFIRGKIRDDIFKNLKYFTKYDIIGDERPDNVADKVYGNPAFDWVVLISNNILNVYDEWPKTQYAFDKYLLEKYGSYEKLYDIHHYETVEYSANTGVVIIPGGKIVNEGYFKAPEYKVETDTTIQLPTIVPGTFAQATASISDTKVVNLNLINAGIGYTDAFITFSDPATPITGIATAVLSVIPGEREVASITLIEGGRGYTSAPTVTFSDPPPTIAGIATAVIGVGGTITNVSIGNSGDGYTFTPTVVFSEPEDILGGAQFISTSTVTLSTIPEGSYISPDGVYLFTAHGITGVGTVGYIDQYTLSTPWDMSTATFTRSLSLNIGGVTFTYASGVEFRPTGRTMYVSGLTNTGFKIVSYGLSSEWNISTASVSGNASVPAPAGIRFQDDGKAVFIVDENDSYKIKKYRLLTAWNISSLYDVLQTNDLSTIVGDNQIYGFTFTDDGKEIYVTGIQNSSIHLLSLSTPWNIETLRLVSSLDVSGTDAWPVEAFTRFDRKRLYLIGDINRKIYTYNIDLTATGFVTISNEKIDQFVITNAGGGYLNPPTITIQPPIPARRAVGYAVVSNAQITQMILTDGGYNYRTPPTITISDAPEAIRAEGRAITQDGQVIDLEITNPGNGYASPPTIFFSTPENLYEPALDEVFERNGQEWKFDGYNWRRRISYGTLYYDEVVGQIIEVSGNESSIAVTNYDYEIAIEDKKRNIFVLKSEYLDLLFNDIENMMEYKEGSEQYLSRTLKRADNPRFYE